jgi:hypothetical protein
MAKQKVGPLLKRQDMHTVRALMSIVHELRARYGDDVYELKAAHRSLDEFQSRLVDELELPVQEPQA